MKIISKFKDYYDHEIAYFGRDETRVYDRRGKMASVENFIRGNNDWLNFHICGELHKVLWLDGKFYFKYSDELEGRQVRYSFYVFHPSNFNIKKTNLNLKERKPVILESPFGGYYIPKLSDFGFAGHISSREMCAKIYEFLGFLKDNPPIEDKQTSKEKVVSHGFDVKTSFRPKIKNK